MTRTHQLEGTLKSLSLSGMLDTLEARLAQAHAGDLGHVEFLQALCEDELARRDAAGIERRLRQARFEQACAIEDFDFSFNAKVPAAQIRDLATLRFIRNAGLTWPHLEQYRWLDLAPPPDPKPYGQVFRDLDDGRRSAESGVIRSYPA